ncbi:S8 family serine peptidase, partial [bacterium]|nr:S8 family serine peptidase [bacterium]
MQNSIPIHRSLLCILLVIALIMTFSNQASAQSNAFSTVSVNKNGQLPASTNGSIVDKSAYNKLESVLFDMLSLRNQQGSTALVDYVRKHNITMKDGKVLVELQLRSGFRTNDINFNQLTSFEVKVDSRPEHFITVWIPIGQLSEFAKSLDMVSLVHRPLEPMPDIISEGVDLIGAVEFHDFGISGEGVTLAVFDAGFAQSTEAREDGELPDFRAVNYTGEAFNEGNVHGTGCAEIIYDLAPDAEFSLVKITNSAHFEEAITWAVDQGIDVVSMSLAWWIPQDDYYNGNDVMSELVNDAFDTGLLFVNSSGNYANQHYRADLDDQDQEDNFHRFADGIVVNHFGPNTEQAYNIGENVNITASLVWDDYPVSDQDIDFQLVWYNGDGWVTVAASEGEQNGDDRPTEYISYVTENAGQHGLRVHAYDAENGRDFTIITNYNLGYRTPEGSMGIPAVAENCFTVGAMYWNDWNVGEATVESFSSRGPTYDDRIKPEIVGPDAVSTLVYGEEAFYGTSAACPHVAGAAALVLAEDLNRTNQDIWDNLVDNAVDHGEEGRDNLFGWGKVQLEAQEASDNLSEFKITADDAAAGDWFGGRVSIDGDYAIVGAYHDDDNGEESGSAYIFLKNGNDWIQQAKLTPEDGAAGDWFGTPVHINGEYAIIGSHRDNDDGHWSGSAYIFKRNGEEWSQQAKLTANDAEADDIFGNGVAISNDFAVIGAQFEDNRTGSIYVFVRNGNEWTQHAKLTADDAEAGDHFGCEVSIFGNYIVTGGHESDDDGNSSGSAYIFYYNGEEWTQQAKLTASDADEGDVFGEHVSIDGERVIIGAPYNSDDAWCSGAAYIFVRDGNEWNEQAKLTASDPAEDDCFGNQVWIDGDYAIVSGSQSRGAGAAYLFEYDGENWNETIKLTPADGSDGDYFGSDVSIDGNYVLVGAQTDDDNGENSGSAYIYTGFAEEQEANISLLGHLETPDNASFVVVRDNTAYIACYQSGLMIVDVSDPENPEEISTFNTPGDGRRVTIRDNLAYVGDGWRGLQIIDISDLENPEGIGSIQPRHFTYCAAVRDDFAYVCEDGAGLRIVDISDPTNPSEISVYDTPGSAYRVEIMDNLAYVADAVEGLRIIDISDPENLEEVGSLNTDGYTYNVDVIDNLAYLADGSNGLLIVDISDPSDPREIAHYETPSIARDVLVRENLAFIADQSDGVIVIDISDIDNLHEITSYDTDGTCYRLALQEDMLYVADFENGLVILDISDFIEAEEEVPSIAVSPGSIETNLDIPATEDQTLTISNRGEGVLDFEIEKVLVSEPERIVRRDDNRRQLRGAGRDSQTGMSALPAINLQTRVSAPPPFSSQTRMSAPPKAANQTSPLRDNSGDDLASYEVPYDNWTGLAWDGQYMWGLSYTNNRMIAYNPENGDVVHNIEMRGGPLGMTFDGELIWAGNWDGDMISFWDTDGNYVGEARMP